MEVDLHLSHLLMLNQLKVTEKSMLTPSVSIVFPTDCMIASTYSKSSFDGQKIKLVSNVHVILTGAHAILSRVDKVLAHVQNKVFCVYHLVLVSPIYYLVHTTK